MHCTLLRLCPCHTHARRRSCACSSGGRGRHTRRRWRARTVSDGLAASAREASRLPRSRYRPSMPPSPPMARFCSEPPMGRRCRCAARSPSPAASWVRLPSMLWSGLHQHSPMGASMSAPPTAWPATTARRTAAGGGSNGASHRPTARQTVARARHAHRAAAVTPDYMGPTRWPRPGQGRAPVPAARVPASAGPAGLVPHRSPGGPRDCHESSAPSWAAWERRRATAPGRAWGSVNLAGFPSLPGVPASTRTLPAASRAVIVVSAAAGGRSIRA